MGRFLNEFCGNLFQSGAGKTPNPARLVEGLIESTMDDVASFEPNTKPAICFFASPNSIIIIGNAMLSCYDWRQPHKRIDGRDNRVNSNGEISHALDSIDVIRANFSSTSAEVHPRTDR